MDLQKTYKRVLTAIILYFFRFVIFIMFIIFLAIIVSKTPMDPETFFNEIDKTVMAVLSFVFLVTIIIAISYLILYILSVVDAYNFKDDQLPFVLLIIGFFTPIIGLVGLFLFRSKIKAFNEYEKQVLNGED